MCSRGFIVAMRCCVGSYDSIMSGSFQMSQPALVEPKPKRKLKISKWDPGCLEPTSTIFLIGRRGTGKSTLLRDIAYHLHSTNKIDVGIGMSPTEAASESLGKFLPNSLIYSGYSEKKLQQIMEIQRVTWEKGTGYNVLLCLDDCCYDKAILKTKTFRELMMNGRHRKITLILTTQYCLDLPPPVRSNIDVVFMARDNLISNKKRLYEQFAGFFACQADFNKTFAALTTNYELMVIDNKTTQSNDLSDCVKWYKANPDIPAFRLGSDWVYKLHDRYQCEHKPRPKAATEISGLPIGNVVKGDFDGMTVVDTLVWGK